MEKFKKIALATVATLGFGAAIMTGNETLEQKSDKASAAQAAKMELKFQKMDSIENEISHKLGIMESTQKGIGSEIKK